MAYTFLQAMARMEGWYKAGSRPRRNNNPGDVEFGQFAKAHGAIKAEQPLGRFAVFPTEEAGFDAMRALFRAPSYAGLTVHQAISRWAPPPENDTEHYVRMVCEWVGCKPTDPIAPLVEAGAPQPAGSIG